MSTTQPEILQSAMKDVSEVLMFENWLRFYFIVEEDGKLILRVPEKALEQIRGQHPDLAGLAELLADEEMDYQKSYDTVCGYVARHLDGARYEPGVCEGIFNSRAFRLESQLFNLWLQAHESQLDQGFLDFGTWMRLFGEWKRSDEVKNYLKDFQAELLRSAKPESGPLQ